ncbi:hypothetical protein, conserved [Plasmodium gonderi]|uniref:Uncharacterized protein n=1 Tax=Plasmodium gonderi TaxID=77519 RepID=A0A1Y1JHW2_PLAGO|nr:hypothetical protein, conserved [Plasmodium gonderi]GAW82101.1 hypothetical protein, conserved [Plasmodium gonderi]
MLRKGNKGCSNNLVEKASGANECYMEESVVKDGKEEKEEISDEMSDEVTSTASYEETDESKESGGNFGLSDFLSYKENSNVLRKFFIFVLLIILSPIILIVLYKYVFTVYFSVSKDNALLCSLFSVVVYIITLTLFYSYLAFNEGGTIDITVSDTQEKKWK